MTNWTIRPSGSYVSVRLSEEESIATVERSHEGATWIADLAPKEALILASELLKAAAEVIR